MDRHAPNASTLHTKWHSGFGATFGRRSGRLLFDRRNYFFDHKTSIAAKFPITNLPIYPVVLARLLCWSPSSPWGFI